MSHKWRRSQAWDDAHIPAALWPVKSILRALSSVRLAVVLLSLVVLYGVLASVPLGVLLLIPTVLFDGLTLVVLFLAAGVPTLFLLRRLLRDRVEPGLRRGVLLLAGLALGAASLWLWLALVWPHLRYDAASGSGVRFFASLVEKYGSTTLRRLPGIELSEVEFYGAWPLRVILLVFVLNMIVATVRRIEFVFLNIGVLSVHAGIVLLALGSVYYSTLKLEGDTVLLAALGPEGVPIEEPGPAQRAFFDAMRPALFIKSGDLYEQRPIPGLPRYNDSFLSAADGDSARQIARQARPWEGLGSADSLDIPIPSPPGDNPLLPGRGVKARIVGFAAYAEPVEDWVLSEPLPGEKPEPVRFVFLHSRLPKAQGSVGDEPVFAFTLRPNSPAGRLGIAGSDELGDTLRVEHTIGTSEERWRDLSEPLPPQTLHALVVRVGNDRRVVSVREGSTLEIAGFRLEVRELHRRPPFPIITPGYENARSGLAVVRVTTPQGETYDRWIYDRFPELSQDLLASANTQGRPGRRAADGAITIGYLDASASVSVRFDERPDGSTRAIVRSRGGGVRVHENIGDRLEDFVPQLALSLGPRWAHARRVDRPAPTPASQQDRSLIGTREKAMAALELSLDGDASPRPWRRIVWLPFTKYFGVLTEAERSVTLPDGRTITLVLGRLRHQLPFAARLVDFEMLSYDHRGSPRDYQSTVRVETSEGPYEHTVSLNAPLRAPFMWSQERGLAGNLLGSLAAGLSPNQFKLSQAGWDAQGWARTQKLADEGVLDRPFASFTILQVGNNPGIHAVALGGVLVALGIPWAFYLKPYLVRRRSEKIRRDLQARTPRPAWPHEPASADLPRTPVAASSET